MKHLLFWAFIFQLAAGCGGQRCGDAVGGYCGVGESCCYSQAGEVLSYCCEGESTKCCGESADESICCKEEEECLKDCIRGTYSCGPIPRKQSATQCSQQCCGTDCCSSCCNGQCINEDDHCCQSDQAPAPFSPTSSCPSSHPLCCPSQYGRDFSATCCHVDSSCCAGCENSDQCCGGCNCCSSTSYCSIDEKVCIERSFSWLIPLLIVSWYLSITVTIISLSWKLLTNPIRTPLHTYHEIWGDPNICENCGHLHHVSLCAIVTVNYERDCQTCLDGCGRRGCHGGGQVCNKGFMSKQEVIRSRKTSGLAYDSVVVQSINAVCSCQGCTCKHCVYQFECSCTHCTCRYCRGFLANTPRWALYPLLNGCYLFALSLLVLALFPSINVLILTLFAAGYTALWLAAIYFLVRLPVQG
eukprot:TRINITY_DN4278_c1_g3_i1.p1 TRINITY_DN4278_c1_g3~~TRINITY_DN4278_c1_g3_i1.p1  ORF type:complete len:445 (+),score=43.99 TRINITY_DN4278_c1_g3_i1:96-1337(+)